MKYLAVQMRAGETITAEAIESVGTYPVYGGNGLRGYTDAKTHTGTRILIGRQGALCGNVHLVDGDFWASEHAIVVQARDDVDPRWLAHLLGVMNLGQYSQTVAQPGIGTAQVNALAVPAPLLDEQRAIADFLDRETARIDTLIEEQRRLIDLLRERRSSTVSQATTNGVPVPLGRVLARIRQGTSPNCEPWPADGVTEWAVLKVGCSNTGRFRPVENKRLPDSTAPIVENVVLQGEIVMSRSNSKELVGSASVVEGSFPRLLLSDLTYGLSVTPAVTAEYVVYALAGSRARWAIEAMAKGTSPSMQKISQRDVRDIPIAVPPPSEQHRIVAYLDEQTSKIDTLIAETERFIDLVRERRSALITAAVTGQIDVREEVAS